VQFGANSTSTQIDAARIRLRSSRITASVSATQLPSFTIGPLPSFLVAAGFAQIHVDTLSPPAASAYTEFGGTGTNISQIAIGNSVSLRGQFFANGSTPALVATKVIRH
jgi:hypothetical protein